MHQIKTFYGHSTEEVDNKVNSWLKQTMANVIDIKQTIYETQTLVPDFFITVLYKAPLR